MHKNGMSKEEYGSNSKFKYQRIAFKEENDLQIN